MTDLEMLNKILDYMDQVKKGYQSLWEQHYKDKLWDECKEVLGSERACLLIIEDLLKLKEGILNNVSADK